MTTRWWSFLAASAVVAACGGKSDRHDVPSEDLTPAAGMPGGGSGGGSGSAGAGSGPIAAGQAGAGGGKSYVPSNPLVSPEGDGSLTGGSFEGNFGDGWDSCGNVRAEFSIETDANIASDGEKFLRFDSSRSCNGDCMLCSHLCMGSELPLILGPSENVPAGETKHLYFDILNLVDTPPTGVLIVATPRRGSDNPCKAGDILATIPLEELALTRAWQTRCVSITRQESLGWFGFYVSDGNFVVGLDAFRFGPPCHE